MTEPICRTCYLESLPDSQKERFLAEPVTTCVYHCPDHQAKLDKLLAALDVQYHRVDHMRDRGLLTLEFPRYDGKRR